MTDRVHAIVQCTFAVIVPIDEAKGVGKSRSHMKLALITLATVIAGAALPISQAHAGSCNSAAKITSDLWKENDVVVKKLGCAVVIAASEGAVPMNACLDAADKFAKMTTDMIKAWNDASKNSWAKIGPRRLDFGESQQGRLVSTGGRMFVSPVPANKNTLEITLEKLDGKSKTEVTVCSNDHGKDRKEWTFEVPSGKDSIGRKWTKTIKNAKGRIYTVHLDGKSLSDTMQYKLSTKLR